MALAHSSASIPVLPVTKICDTGTFSRTRFCRLAKVGAKCRPATVEMTRRFSSSGKGVRLSPPVRRPASTCITGIRMWKEASEAAIAELVSPWTRTVAGRRPLIASSALGTSSGSISKRSTQKSSKRRITEETRSFNAARRAPAQSTTSGLIPASSKM